jgi:hypothetical protein
MSKILKVLKPGKASWLFLLFAVLVGSLSGGRCLAQSRHLTQDQVMARIRKAHIVSTVSPHSFDSYRFAGCMYITQAALPRKAQNPRPNCITEETGVLQPSLAYVSIVIGNTRVTELIDTNQTKGWNITSSGSLQADRNVSLLQKFKYDALLENTQHSLLALLGILNRPDAHSGAGLQVSFKANAVVINWRDGDRSNEFWFNRRTFLCERQVRTVPAGTTVLKYSNYKTVSNVMLPHTILMLKADGTTLATREVGQWSLAKQWQNTSFDPALIGGLD